jgi:hypothetical protein
MSPLILHNFLIFDGTVVYSHILEKLKSNLIYAHVPRAKQNVIISKIFSDAVSPLIKHNWHGTKVLYFPRYVFTQEKVKKLILKFSEGINLQVIIMPYSFAKVKSFASKPKCGECLEILATLKPDQKVETDVFTSNLKKLQQLESTK